MKTITEKEIRFLGASGITVPPMGVGTAHWGAGFQGYGRTYTRDDIYGAYRACLDAGLNFIDTAEVYGNGDSERLLGEFRKQDGRPIMIATKYSNPSSVALRNSRSPASGLLRALDASLKRLNVEQVDLYMIHRPLPPQFLDETVDVLAQAFHSGKVRAVGVSNFNAPLLRQAQKRFAEHNIPLAANQVAYNLLMRYPEDNGVLEACRELNIALMAYSPQANGILAGKFRPGVKSVSLLQSLFFRVIELDPFKEGRGRESLLRRLIAPYPLRQNKLEPLFVEMEEIAKAHGKTINQVALNWLLVRDPLVIPIPGAKNARQAQQNAGALGWRLSNEECDRINQAQLTM